MSRIGRKPVVIPAGVKVVWSAPTLTVEGPKGKLQQVFREGLSVEVTVKGLTVKVTPPQAPWARAQMGLVRSLAANMVGGVVTGFTKQLEIEGVGFRAQVQGKTLSMYLGFSHPVTYQIPDGVEVKAPKPTTVTVSGLDKALVGQVAVDIRRFFPPEPYKGKGIRYAGEVIRRKQGKTMAKTA